MSLPAASTSPVCQVFLFLSLSCCNLVALAAKKCLFWVASVCPSWTKQSVVNELESKGNFTTTERKLGWKETAHKFEASQMYSAAVAMSTSQPDLDSRARFRMRALHQNSHHLTLAFQNEHISTSVFTPTAPHLYQWWRATYYYITHYCNFTM